MTANRHIIAGVFLLFPFVFASDRVHWARMVRSVEGNGTDASEDDGPDTMFEVNIRVFGRKPHKGNDIPSLC